MGCGASKKGPAPQPAEPPAPQPAEPSAPAAVNTPSEAATSSAAIPASEVKSDETAAPAAVEVDAPVATEAVVPWKSLYGLLGMFSTSNHAETVAFLKKEGAEQMADVNEDAPMWTVLGQSSVNAEKVCWVGYFADKNAYNVTHKAAQEPGKGRADFPAEMMKHGANAEGGFPANMAGFTFGAMLHLENDAKLPTTGYAVVASRQLADAEAAAAFVEAEKSHWAQLMAGGAKESLCRVTLFGPGADVPLPWVPAGEVRTLHQWVSKEAYEASAPSIRDGDESTDVFGEPEHFVATR